MHGLKIDAERCNGCKTCMDACFVNAIGWLASENLPVLAYPEDCQICTVCERACPKGAAEIIPDWQSKYCPPYLSTQRR